MDRSQDHAAATNGVTPSVPNAQTADRDRGARVKRAGGLGSQVVVCCSGESAVEAVQARVQDDDVEVRPIVIDRAAGSLLRRRSDKQPVVMLIGKSMYLLRVFELPTLSGDEAQDMLSLEAEQIVPPEFGEVEVSYVRSDSENAGHSRYEAYIARRDDLERAVARLVELGLTPDLVLPSAVVWRELCTRADAPDLWVAAGPMNELEVASLGGDRSLAVRTIGGQQRPIGGADHHRGLIDHLRSVLGQAPAGDGPLTVGWVGNDCPTDWRNGRIRVEDHTERWVKRSVDKNIAGAETESEPASNASAALLYLAGESLLRGPGASEVMSANLLPRSITSVRDRRTVIERAAMSAACLLLAVVLGIAGLKVATVRYATAHAALLSKIEQIKWQGEAVGERIDQLRAIERARQTHGRLHDTLAGLASATPRETVSYSEVTLTEEGALRLRGQAEVLSLATALPQMLEAQTVFRDVQLQSAGVIQKGDGSVAEFTIDARLAHGAGP